MARIRFVPAYSTAHGKQSFPVYTARNVSNDLRNTSSVSVCNERYPELGAMHITSILLHRGSLHGWEELLFVYIHVGKNILMNTSSVSVCNERYLELGAMQAFQFTWEVSMVGKSF